MRAPCLFVCLNWLMSWAVLVIDEGGRVRTNKYLAIAITLALAVGMVPIPAFAGGSELIPGDEFVVTDMYGPQNQIELWGDMVFMRNGVTMSCPPWDIWAVDLSTGAEFPIYTGPDTQNNPSVYDDVVVWSDASDDIMVKDLRTGDEYALDTGDDACCLCNPFIWGDTIVWVDDRADQGDDIWAYNMETEEATVVAGGEGDQDMPELYGDKLVYRHSADKGDDAVCVLDLSTMVETTVTAESESGSCDSPSIWGDDVVWSQGSDVWAYNMSTALRAKVASGTSYDCTDVSEGIVVWAGSRNTCSPPSDDAATDSQEEQTCRSISDNYTRAESDVTDCTDVSVAADAEEDTGTGVDIYGYELATGTEFVICDEYAKQKRPRIFEGTVVWQDMRDTLDDSEKEWSGPDIYGMRLEPMYSSVAGDDRFETACESARKAFPSGARSVVIATGFNWPDALVASSLAGAIDGPVLLSRTDSLPAVTAAEIQRMGADNAYIIGGPAAISEAVEEDLEVMLDGFVERIAGSERRGTANLVAKEAVAELGKDFDGSALVVTSLNYPDAMCAAPAAAASGTPMFLAGNEGVAASSLQCMVDLGVTDVVIVGGEGAVPAIAETQLNAKFGDANVQRIGGATRYHTAADMAQWGVDELGLEWDGLALATGQSFPDALTGGVLQGLMGSTLMLTPSYTLHGATEAKLVANKADIPRVKFLGGVAAVGQDVRDEVKAILSD